MDGTTIQTPLTEGSIQEGGGVCVNKYTNSLSKGRPASSNVVKRRQLADCGESRTWSPVPSEMGLRMGEQDFFVLNNMMEEIVKQELESSNSYVMRLYQRSYPDFSSSCASRLPEWEAQLRYLRTEDNWEIIGLIFCGLLLQHTCLQLFFIIKKKYW